MKFYPILAEILVLITVASWLGPPNSNKSVMLNNKNVCFIFSFKLMLTVVILMTSLLKRLICYILSEAIYLDISLNTKCFLCVQWFQRQEKKICHWSRGCVCLVSWQPAAGKSAPGYTGDRQNYIPCHAQAKHTHTHTGSNTEYSEPLLLWQQYRKAPLAGKHITWIHSPTISLSLPNLRLLLC